MDQHAFLTNALLLQLNLTRLALASVLAPFGVHLLKFTLTTMVRDLPNLSRSLKTPGVPITSGTLSACRSLEAKDD